MCAHCRLVSRSITESECKLGGSLRVIESQSTNGQSGIENSYCIRDVELRFKSGGMFFSCRLLLALSFVEYTNNKWCCIYTEARPFAQINRCIHFVRMYNWDECENFNLKLGDRKESFRCPC